MVRFLTEHGIPAYDEETHSGLVRHLYLRRGEETGEVLLCLVLNGSGFSDEAAFAAEMTARYPEIVGVLVNENSARTNVVLGERYRLLAGKDYLTDRLCGLTYRISPESFYQVNHDACELLYGLAKDRAGLTGHERLIDLYCGIGTIGLTMADRAAEVLGLEIVPQAVECARENAMRNGIVNARFVCGDAGDPDDARKSRAAFGRRSVGRGGRARPAAQRNDAGTDRRIGCVPRSARGLYLLQPRYFGKGLRGLCRSRLPPGDRDPRGSFSENRPCGIGCSAVAVMPTARRPKAGCIRTGKKPSIRWLFLMFSI